jgi:ABC-type uncharacterized transport system auxiliary subunit
VHVRIAGVVTRFEVVDERVARLEARWVATRSEDGRVVARGAWVGEEPIDGEGVAAGVAAMSRVLGALSREIAKPLAP